MNQVREVYDRFKDYTETDWSAFANSQQNDWKNVSLFSNHTWHKKHARN
jgi:hypothetical protein